MSDPRMERWARTLVRYSVEAKPGDVVGIVGGVAAEPLLRAIYRETIAVGAMPILLTTFSGLDAELIASGSDAQLDFVSPIDRFMREGVDCLIRVSAETNTRAGSGLDPARQRRYEQARSDLGKILMQRAADGSLRWSSTLYPTDAYAQDAEMNTEDFTEFILRACKLHLPDPAAAWRQLHDDQQRLIDYLVDKREIRITGPDTDLTLSVAGRSWNNSDGHRNFPSGEIFTGPIEDSANGHIRFSFPVVTKGREVHDIRLRFENGKVTDASAAKEEAFLLSTLETDPGARYLGEFAFGTNMDIQRFSKQILLDEKIGGTVHMALGAGYPDTGSTNRSAIHWDLICDLRTEGEVTVDGVPFLRGGKYLESSR